LFKFINFKMFVIFDHFPKNTLSIIGGFCIDVLYYGQDISYSTSSKSFKTKFCLVIIELTKDLLVNSIEFFKA
jgi:hypothetical protein